jgi:hypothetical protein
MVLLYLRRVVYLNTKKTFTWGICSCGILSFIAGCFLPNVSRPRTGLIFKGQMSNILQSSLDIRSLKMRPLSQGCTNPERQVAVATKFLTVAPNIWGSAVWNLLHVVLLTPRILRWLIVIWNLCAPLYYAVWETLGKRHPVIERNATGEGRSQLHGFESLKTRTKHLVLNVNYDV